MGLNGESQGGYGHFLEKTAEGEWQRGWCIPVFGCVNNRRGWHNILMDFSYCEHQSFVWYTYRAMGITPGYFWSSLKLASAHLVELCSPCTWRWETVELILFRNPVMVDRVYTQAPNIHSSIQKRLSHCNLHSSSDETYNSVEFFWIAMRKCDVDHIVARSPPVLYGSQESQTPETGFYCRGRATMIILQTFHSPKLDH